MSEHHIITRRKLLQRTTALAGICTAHGFALAKPTLSQFDYGEVQLAPGPLQRQFEENHHLLLKLSEDSLLKPFRQREGLPAPGKDLGGWYDTYAFAPGASYGQWMSALARFYAVTRDEATRAKVNRMVRGYAATIDAAGKFYVENRFPAYIYDKLVCGLSDAHAFAHDPNALRTLALATEAVSKHLPEKAMPHQETPLRAREDFTRHCWDESYTLPENLFLAWERTGTSRYLEMAKRYLFDEEYFDPLARGENVLPGRHAYSHVNALSSAARAYLVLGEPKYFQAAKNGFAMVEEQSFATGGWGPDEHFVVPGSGKLGDSLNKTHASFETPCGSYAHFKIGRYLLRTTKDSRYGDSMERVMYNTVLGAKPIQPDGSAFYYSDYNFQGHKVYHRDKWPCCSGTLPQIAADYRISAYFRDDRNIYVNLYVPSTVTWSSAGRRYSVRQTTEYPYESHIRFDMTTSSPENFSVFFRIPQWADGARLSINGIHASRPLHPGAFAEINREWKTGDRVEVELPLKMRLEAVDRQHPNTVALLAGPLVLMPVTHQPPDQLRPATLLSAKRTSGTVRAWTVGSDYAALRLKAFMDIQDEQYTTYLRVLSA
jgi:uncharacterized protein